MSAQAHFPLGLGIGWRPDLSNFILDRADLGFVEVVAESLSPRHPLPLPLEAVLRRGVPAVPHGIRLSLGSAEAPERRRVMGLANCAERLGSPLVSEHIAFVRAAGIEAGHLLPLPRTREALDVLVANVRSVQRDLPVPIALEPVASLIEWPDAEMDEAAFLTDLLERTDAWLLLDVANLYANHRNHGGDPLDLLASIPLERVAYVHVAGGVEIDGLYHDTHSHPTSDQVIDLLAEASRQHVLPGVMLERDDSFPPEVELAEELDRIAHAAFGATRLAPASAR